MCICEGCECMCECLLGHGGVGVRVGDMCVLYYRKDKEYDRSSQTTHINSRTSWLFFKTSSFFSVSYGLQEKHTYSAPQQSPVTIVANSVTSFVPHSGSSYNRNPPTNLALPVTEMQGSPGNYEATLKMCLHPHPMSRYDFYPVMEMRRQCSHQDKQTGLG